MPALLPLAVSVYGSAGVLVHGRRRDYAIAAAGLGLAAATKYTAGIAVLPLAAAIVGRAVSVPADRRRVLGGAGLAAALAVAVFIAANPHAVLSFDEFWDDLRRQQDAASGFGKLGLSYDSGIVYYLWTFTWGLGWIPLAAAALGAVVALRRDAWRGLMLVPWPVVFTLYMGLQDRFFGRWLLPAFPALALLAAVGGVWLVDRLRAPGTRRARAGGREHGARGPGARLLGSRGSGALARRHPQHRARLDDGERARRLEGGGRADRPRRMVHGRGRARRAGGVRAGGRRALRPAVDQVRDRAHHLRPGQAGWPRPAPVRERGELRAHARGPSLVGSYERGGYCWVVVGSTQYGRALVDPQEVPEAIAYYRQLARRGRLVFRSSPYGSGDGPVEFNFDWSFDYYPRAYERPGPSVAVYRLHGGRCGGGLTGESAQRQ